MKIGVSTACFYPEETERALERVCKAGIKTVEIFLNSFSESDGPLLDEMARLTAQYGISVKSVHPYITFGESYLMFSDYYRRFLDTAELLKKCFYAANRLGAEICICHGELLPGKISEQEYFERFAYLCGEAKKYGITFTQENVVRFRSQSMDMLDRMKKALGDEFKLTFDVKQAVRSGINPIEFAERFGESIVNIHISDHNETSDCMPPMKGNFDFDSLFRTMNTFGYDGDYIIELYRNGFENTEELMDSYENITKMLKNYCNL